MKRILAAVLLVPFLAGCPTSTVPATWVQADRARYDAISPEYKAYYAADGTLSLEDRARRDRTLEAWKADLEAHEAAVKAGVGN